MTWINKINLVALGCLATSIGSFASGECLAAARGSPTTAAVVEADKLFLTPDSLLGQKIKVTAGILCFGLGNCVLGSPNSLIVVMKIDTRKLSVTDKQRLARDCSSVVCIESLVGSLTADGFAATGSYDVQLTSNSLAGTETVERQWLAVLLHIAGQRIQASPSGSRPRQTAAPPACGS